MIENPYSAPHKINDQTVKRPFLTLRRIRNWLTVVAVISVLVAMLLPATSRSRPSARRTQCKNNLKQILLALHNYESNYRSFPPAYTVDDKGQPLHSWRTLILPFLEHHKLYNSIDLSKPWNDPANAAAFATQMPYYQCPMDKIDGPLTTYQAVVGPGAGFESSGMRKIADFRDGTSSTILVIEVEPSKAVHWMSPFDHGYEYLLTLGPDTKTTHPGGTHAAIADGSTRFLSNQLNLPTRRALITINGGETIGDW